tara:strand:- start:285 stop:680 length:396 start_codon:yes stop_codon:yes gene_type:complete
MNLLDFRDRVSERLPGSKLTLASDDDARKLASDYPDLPPDYFDLITIVGSGTFGDGGFSIYSGGPVTPDEIYGDSAADIADVLLIGDDFCGYCLGYRAGQLGEVSDFGDWESLGDELLVDFLNGRLFGDSP